MPTAPSVLIVDDEPAVRDVMARWTTALGLQPRTAASAEEALATLRGCECDLAVIDVMMPGRNGLWLAGELQRHHPRTAVVLATGYAEALVGETEDRPVADLLIKPFHRARFALAVDRGREWRKRSLDELRWNALLLLELDDRAAQIKEDVARQSRDGVAEEAALVAIAAARTPDVVTHGERVCRYARAVARQLGIDDDASRLLDVAARFHDIGKAAMPSAVLTKPSPLTAGEAAIMRRHVDVGADILEATRALVGAAPLVRSSHEWFNGGGYPSALAGNAIPLVSRIIAVTDAYDAMTQDRAYRSRCDLAEALDELGRCAGRQFDQEIVEAFRQVLTRQ